MISNVPMMRQNRSHPVETSEMHYNQNMTTPLSHQHQHVMPMTSNYYDRQQSYKRKNEFGDGSSYRSDKIMRSNYNMVHGAKDSEYDLVMTSPGKSQRHYPTSGSSTAPMQKVFDRHNLGSGDGEYCLTIAKTSLYNALDTLPLNSIQWFVEFLIALISIGLVRMLEICKLN